MRHYVQCHAMARSQPSVERNRCHRAAWLDKHTAAGRVDLNTGGSSPLHSFTPLTHSHLQPVPSPTWTWFPWQLTNLPSEWSHSVWPQGMTGYDKRRYSIRAITCDCTVWWPSFFSFCLSFIPSISRLSLFLNFTTHYPAFSHFLCISLCLPPTRNPFVLSRHSTLFSLTPLLASSVLVHLVSISISFSRYLSFSLFCHVVTVQRPAAVVGQSEECQHHLSETRHQLSLPWQRQVQSFTHFGCSTWI